MAGWKPFQESGPRPLNIERERTADLKTNPAVAPALIQFRLEFWEAEKCTCRPPKALVIR
jgi:hypothetical protein